MTDLPLAREYLMQRRRALIIELDAIEDALEIHPRNRDLRRDAKEEESLRKAEFIQELQYVQKKGSE